MAIVRSQPPSCPSIGRRPPCPVQGRPTTPNHPSSEAKGAASLLDSSVRGLGDHQSSLQPVCFFLVHRPPKQSRLREDDLGGTGNPRGVPFSSHTGTCVRARGFRLAVVALMLQSWQAVAHTSRRMAATRRAIFSGAGGECGTKGLRLRDDVCLLLAATSLIVPSPHCHCRKILEHRPSAPLAGSPTATSVPLPPRPPDLQQSGRA